MKLLKYIPVALLSLMAFASCDSDLDKVTYKDSDAKAGSFTAIASSYVLDESKSEDVVETFKWTAATFGYDAAITYKVEIGLAGKDFANKQVVASVIGKTSASVTHKELNAILALLNEKYGISLGETASYDIRVTAAIGDVAALLYYNVLTADITTYAGGKDVIYITGNLLKNVPQWKNSIGDIGTGLLILFADDSKGTNGLYNITTDLLAGGEAKFPVKAGVWDPCWGKDADGTLKLDNGTPNINSPATAGLYTVTLDLKAKTYTYTPYTGATDTYSTIGALGDATPGSWDNDTDLIEVAPHVWVLPEIDLVAGELKFRANHDWGVNWGGDSNNLPFGKGTKGGSNIKIEEAGKYYLALNDLTGHYIIIQTSKLP